MPKPHGPAYSMRRRCVLCGYIVNSPKRFKWEHKHQTFMVKFGGKTPEGHGIIDYKEVPDEEYDKIMVAALRRAAETFGFRLVKVPA